MMLTAINDPAQILIRVPRSTQVWYSQSDAATCIKNFDLIEKEACTPKGYSLISFRGIITVNPFWAACNGRKHLALAHPLEQYIICRKKATVKLRSPVTQRQRMPQQDI